MQVKEIEPKVAGRVAHLVRRLGIAVTAVWFNSLVVSLFLSVAYSGHARAQALFGMAQVSRDDGLLEFALFGTFKEKSACESKIQEFAANFIESASAEGYKGTFDAGACADRIPVHTEFEALQKLIGTTHYIFYTPNIRMMTVHVRGTLEYERQMCETVRGQMLSKIGIQGKCLAPIL